MLRSRLERKFSMLLSSPVVAELERRAAAAREGAEVLAVERLAVDPLAVVLRAVPLRAVDFLVEPLFALVFLAAISSSSWSAIRLGLRFV
jgi:hypothetical protein